MTEPMKLALIGAGSSYAPDLADILIARRRGG
jgi:alpha-galactosidase/6-phospho-beta-glucosidase family protein